MTAPEYSWPLHRHSYVNKDLGEEDLRKSNEQVLLNDFLVYALWDI